MKLPVGKPSPDAKFFKHELSITLDVCEAVNTPRSLAVYIILKSQDHTEYLSLSKPDIKPEILGMKQTFPDDYLVTEMLRKNPHLRVNIDTKRVAVDKWLSVERDVEYTNTLFSLRSEGRYSFPKDVERVLHSARCFIAKVLGDLDTEKLNYAESQFRFGPGATTALGGADVVKSRKYVCDMHTTPRLYRTALYLNSSNSLWAACRNHVVIADSSRMSFVPKDAKTDRVICIEPHMNIFVQSGIGRLIRRQMMLSGLNLTKQDTVNRTLASLAHRNNLCTIDLASASDTVSYGIVQELLPESWVSLLALGRTDIVDVNEKRHQLHKWSGMGNGYTFELESLIFWALVVACGDRQGVTFGDDIICRRDIAPLLIKCFNSLGFKVNESKTFLEGRFFESCGTDWFDGLNVRPVYLKGTYEDFTSCVIRSSNKLRVYSHRRNLSNGCDRRFFHAWLSSVRRCDQARATGIPFGSGDAGLIRNFDEAVPTLKRRRPGNGFEGYYASVWRGRAVTSKKTSSIGVYVAKLHQLHSLMTSQKDYLEGEKLMPNIGYSNIALEERPAPVSWLRTSWVKQTHDVPLDSSRNSKWIESLDLPRPSNGSWKDSRKETQRDAVPLESMRIRPQHVTRWVDLGPWS